MNGLMKLDRIDINILVQLQKMAVSATLISPMPSGFPRALACNASSAWNRRDSSRAMKRTLISPKLPIPSPSLPKSRLTDTAAKTL